MSHAAAGALDPHHDATTSTGIPNKKLLMWLFLASDCMFFGSLIATHLIYRLNPVEGNPSPTQIFDIELTSGSTFILLMSSLMMALAVEAIQKGNLKMMRAAAPQSGFQQTFLPRRRRPQPAHPRPLALEGRLTSACKCCPADAVFHRAGQAGRAARSPEGARPDWAFRQRPRPLAWHRSRSGRLQSQRQWQFRSGLQELCHQEPLLS